MSIGTNEATRIAIDIMNDDDMPGNFDAERRMFWINTTAQIEEIKKKRGIVDLPHEIPLLRRSKHENL